MAQKTAARRRHRQQCAALPLMEQDGETRVMLVTSRDTGRWVLPKGWVERRVSPHEMAAREAFEEAGIIGAVEAEPLGAYAYPKRLGRGAPVTCKVAVFQMRVEKLLDDWPERRERVRRWFTLRQAAGAVKEPDLGALLLRLADHPTPTA